jgi:hypothetical protein
VLINQNKNFIIEYSTGWQIIQKWGVSQLGNTIVRLMEFILYFTKTEIMIITLDNKSN